ncbi:MAG: lamin tail domain-containing protein [bacterium]|nr:lamin tail domain-containing protein [bacterium]
MSGCHRLLLPILLLSSLLPLQAVADVVINEIMYNSPFTPDVEYIELTNMGPAAVNLGDWYLLDSDLGHPRCYLSGTLAAGGYLVIAADVAIFAVQFPGVANLNPQGFDPGGTGFGLGNGSDTVNLFNDDDLLVDTVAYQDRGAWPTAADGQGSSLELVNPALDNSVAANWLASGPVGGTPGAVNSVYAANSAPTCGNGARDIDLPTAADAVTVTVEAQDAEALAGVALWVSTGGAYATTPMLDDGLHGDGAAGDGVFGAQISAQANGTLVRYYAVATDAIGQAESWPNGAPADYRAYTVGHLPPRLVVNEIVASNVAGAVDDMGEHEDWIEIFNPGSVAVDLGGMYLTDDFGNRNKWEIPAGVTIGAGARLVFWADEQPEQGPLHADVKLSASGEEVAVCTARDFGNVRIHGFKFGPVAADVAVGYRPDFGGVAPAGLEAQPEYLTTPTPGADNGSSALYSTVCINEFHTTSLGGGVDDWVELYNRGATPVDIGGWYLSDNRTDNLKYQFPAGTVLSAGGYYSVDEETLGFGFSSAGEVVVLTAPDGTSGLDFHDFQAQTPDRSRGRFPDGAGLWGYFAGPSRGAANLAPAAADDDDAALPRPLVSAVRAVPNPFNPQTEIRFELGKAQDVGVVIFDVRGRRVRTLHEGPLAAGHVALRWDGRDDNGARLPSGVYSARVVAGGAAHRSKVLLLK